MLKGRSFRIDVGKLLIYCKTDGRGAFWLVTRTIIVFVQYLNGKVSRASHNLEPAELNWKRYSVDT